MSAADRRQVQEALHRLDYYEGPVDGIFGPLTRAAIRRFQQQNFGVRRNWLPLGGPSQPIGDDSIKLLSRWQREVLGVLNPQGAAAVGFKKPTPDELAHDFRRRVHSHVQGNGVGLF